MSIVPYNSRNEIVYYDPAKRLVVLHDNEENTIQLLTSAARADEFDLGAGLPPPPHDDRCPRCGSRFSEYFPRRPPFRRDSHTHSEKQQNIPLQHELLTSEFMHDNYFQVLANIASGNAIDDGNSAALPPDIFNQGYFERFFKKIPPFVLGSGAHAQVYKVMHVLKDIQLGVYAVKRISIGDYAVYLDQVLNEVLILYQLSVRGANENNLIRYNHVWMEHGSVDDLDTILLPEHRYDSRGHGSDYVPYVFILQQYCDGGHLESLIRNNFQREMFMTAKERLEQERQRRRRRKSSASVASDDSCEKLWLSDFEVWKFFKDIANAVHYLHLQGILHRDLKPSNCLLEDKYDVQALVDYNPATVADIEEAQEKLPKVLVSDFGEGKFIDKQYLADQSIQIEVDSNSERRGNTGTIEFTDPRLWSYAKPNLVEAFAGAFSYNSDIYSLGMILCYLCVGKLPFASYIQDHFDPEQIRVDISYWYRSLTRHQFHTWFAESITNRGGETTPLMSDFEELIFTMLKGEEAAAAKLNSTALMKYLEAIKESRFLNAMTLSTLTIPEGSNEPINEALEIDLTKPDVTLRSPTSPIDETTRRSSYEKLFVDIAAYLFLIIVMEVAGDYLNCARTAIRLTKLTNVLCLSIRAFFPTVHRQSFYIGVGVSMVLIAYIVEKYMVHGC